MNWARIAWRNLRNNQRRSLFTVCAIALGFAAINLLGGFTNYVFKGLEDSYVYAYGNGHLSIFKQGFQAKGSLDPDRYLFDGDELGTLRQVLEGDQRIVLATPQLNIKGLISNGQVSTIMVADGRIPADTRRIRDRGRGFVGELQMFTGRELDSRTAYGIGITRGLAEKIDLTLDADAIVMASTVDGFINALDARIVQLIDAPMEILDDMLMTVPLEFARQLYETDGADRMNVLLPDSRQTESVKRDLSQKLSALGLHVEIFSWEQLRPSYLRIRDMFRVIFTFVFIVVLIIVVLSTVNTISMAVLERTREIGTLRSLGLKRRGVMVMFAAEGAILGVIGSLAGMVLTLCAWGAVVASEPTWIPPNIPKEVPLEINLVPWILLLSCVSLTALSAIAAIMPARRASRMSIIEALGHN